MVKSSEKLGVAKVPVTVTLPVYRPAERKEFAAKRLAAAKAIEKAPIPSDKKYSNWERLKLPEAFAGKDIGGIAPKLTIKQDDYDTGYKTIAIPMSKAVKDWPDHVLPYLQEALPESAHYFSAVSAALCTEGAVVVVPNGVTADIRAEFSAESDKLNAYRTIIVLGAGATANYTQVGRGGADATVVHGVEAYVDAGARLSFYELAEWDDDVVNLAAYGSRIGRDATLDWLVGSFGGKVNQIDVESGLAGEGAETKVRGAYFPSDRQHVDQQLTAHHQVGHTTSDTYARGIVGDSARAVYRGMIRIAEGAHGSSADQNGHAMLLGNDARADAIPGLEIDADDVTAGHGATVGQVDPDQLFYLMARGIPEEQARRMLIEGFFEPLLSTIPQPDIRNRFRAAVAAKLG